MKDRENTVLRIREFNRFYMPALDLLGNHYLGSEYCATEARVLFEAYENDGCNAAHIANKMNIDKSYLSRIIRQYEKDGYLVRTVSEHDQRSLDIHLTESGKERAEDLIRRSNQQIGGIIGPLNEEECQALVDALDRVMDILKKCGI